MRLATTPMTNAEAETWQSQVDDLHAKIQRWTGNPLQVLDISFWQWASLSRKEPALFAEVDRDAITLVGAPIPRLVGAPIPRPARGR